MSPISDGQCQSCVKAVYELKFHQLTASYFAPGMFFTQVTCKKNKSVSTFPVDALCTQGPLWKQDISNITFSNLTYEWQFSCFCMCRTRMIVNRQTWSDLLRTSKLCDCLFYRGWDEFSMAGCTCHPGCTTTWWWSKLELIQMKVCLFLFQPCTNTTVRSNHTQPLWLV